jgi:hypothetical protein
MADLRVTCICGAIYEVIKTEGPSREALLNASYATENCWHGREIMLVSFTVRK